MIFGVSLNWWAVVVSAIAAMVIGSIWFGPLFGKMYMSARGMDQWSPEKREAMKKGMVGMYVAQFVCSLVMAAVLNIFILKTGDLTIMHGIKVALAVWLGFEVTLSAGDWLWGGNKTLFWLSSGNELVTIVAMGIILGAWH